MEPQFRKRPQRPKHTIIISTGLLLIATFLLIVLLFFLFSSLVPSFVGPCVAVVDIDMPLSVEGVPPTVFNAGVPGSEELAYTIAQLDEREDVGAVVFVINSPGGSVVATREVYQEVKELDKPKVAYFREVAASGAYYVATGTDYIISDPDALTGNLGVIATVGEMSGLLEKIGVNVTTIKSGTHKDMGSPFRNMTAEEEEILQGVVDEIHEEFMSVILQNRKGRLDISRFDEISDSRIMSGRQAAKVGLVDKTGTKKDAIMKAAELANISAESFEDVRVCPVSTSAGEGGLFSAEAIINIIQAKAGMPELKYQ